MLYSDLQELKSDLDIDPDDHSEDRKLSFLLTRASEWIEELLNRPGLSLKTRTEFYNGSGTQKIQLKSRPVYPSQYTPQVFLDEAAYYGTASGAFSNPNSALVYGTDFTLRLDMDSDNDGVDDASRSGLLIRMNEIWPKPHIRQRGLLFPFVGEGFGTVKVLYRAGYTVDTLPAQVRMACTFLVSKLRYILPLGLELSSDSYEERSISIVTAEKSRLLLNVWPMLRSLRNWKW